MGKECISLFSEADKQRFWGKVARAGEGDCWNWTASLDRYGYGKFRKGPGLFIASRVSLAMHFGRDLDAAEMACHTCDNPACVNPAHLFVGSAKDNFVDAVRKGRVSQDMSAHLAASAKAKAAKTHCKRGHELTGRNLNVRPDGRRRCLACARLTRQRVPAG